MRIVTARRFSQIFFLFIFLWFSTVSTLGEAWWQLRGWPVNWYLQLDPLVGLGTLLTTHTIYAGLLWCLATVVFTILLGRFFCGWLCPFGTIHQIVGFLAKRKKPAEAKAGLNRYQRAHTIKYGVLIVLLAAAVADLVLYFIELPRGGSWVFWLSLVAGLAAMGICAMFKIVAGPRRAILLFFSIVAGWIILSFAYKGDRLLAASLQTGLLDPIPLLYRSVNLVLLPLIDGTFLALSSSERLYEGAWVLGAVFLSAVLLNLIRPRFYCRFVCPLGAFLAVLSRFAVWRIGKGRDACRRSCHLCEINCEGGCAPSSQIRISECVLCCNCLPDCYNGQMGYRTAPSASGQIVSPDISRRAFMISALSGAAAIPMIRLNGYIGSNWKPELVRPPGARNERAFLSRCIKCGQCMRICPTNVLHPAAFEGGLEGVWTPVLNFRAGASGCQLNCIACGNICPTAAIRPISMEERLGQNQYAAKGPIKIGTAFIERGRCLPWAMGRPCIVCQENCPVSPKAIHTRDYFSPVEGLSELRVKSADGLQIRIDGGVVEPGRYTSGDFYCNVRGSTEDKPRSIVENTEKILTVSSSYPWEKPPPFGSRIEILVRLQQPFVDPQRCVGCGVCQHECPVRGRRAIRVSAENESRSAGHALILASASK